MRGAGCGVRGAGCGVRGADKQLPSPLLHCWNIPSFGVTLYIMSRVVSQNPDVLGGEPVFIGTRVPVKSLFDHLEAGDSIEQFLEGFPSVKREQVLVLLEEAREHALAA